MLVVMLSKKRQLGRAMLPQQEHLHQTRGAASRKLREPMCKGVGEANEKEEEEEQERKQEQEMLVVVVGQQQQQQQEEEETGESFHLQRLAAARSGSALSTLFSPQNRGVTRNKRRKGKSCYQESVIVTSEDLAIMRPKKTQRGHSIWKEHDAEEAVALFTRPTLQKYA